MTTLAARARLDQRQLPLVVAMAVSMATVLAVLIYRAGFATPFKDELLFWPLYRSLAEHDFPPLSELVAAHNGHPYLLLKALISLTLLAGLPWTWMMYAQVGVLLLCVLLVVGSRSARMGAVASLVVVSALLSPRQWENLYWAMQLAFPLSLMFSLAAFTAADRYARSTQDTRWAYAALASGLAASVSNGAGIFALGLAGVAVATVSRVARVRVAAFVALAAGIGLFVYAQVLTPRSGIGDAPIDLTRAMEHAVRMMAHQFVDAPPRSPVTLVMGVAASLIVAYAVATAVAGWRDSLFEFLCIALSLLLIAGVTYARVTAGIFQPDAPRYLPLLAPLTIGTVLLLDRAGRRGVLIGMLVVMAVGYALALRSEWRISPYRQENMLAAHQALCVSGSVHPTHDMKVQLPGQALADIRTLFCGELGAGSRQIDHGNIGRSAAKGFYREERHTWVSPRLSLLSLPDPRPTRVALAGWLPDTSAYHDRRFVIEIVAQDAVLSRLETDPVGEFSITKRIFRPRPSRLKSARASDVRSRAINASCPGSSCRSRSNSRTPSASRANEEVT